MIHLDLADKRPLYEQIKEKFKELIVTGAIKEQEKIPSVRELASMLAINPNTIQRAYKELEEEGYIYSQRAKGSFVAPALENNDAEYLNSLYKSLKDTARELMFRGETLKAITDELSRVYETIRKE